MLNRRKFLSLSIGVAVTAPAIVSAAEESIINFKDPLYVIGEQTIESDNWSSSVEYKMGDITIDADGKRYQSVHAYNSRGK